MVSLNKIMLIGRLGANPEVHYTPDGTAVTNFSMATSQQIKKGDHWKEGEPEWHRVVAWGHLAEISEKYLRKGDKVYVEGRLKTRSWEDQEGHKRHTTEVIARNLIMLDSRQPETETPKKPEEEENVPF